MTPSLDDSHTLSGPPVSRADWEILVDRIDAFLTQEALAPERLLVLLPYAQLMVPARRAWSQRHPSGFAPRFETSRSWATSLGPWVAAPSDYSGDLARDTLAAQALVHRVIKAQKEPSLQNELVARLLDAARQLQPIACAVPPAQRAVWAEAKREALAQVPAPHWESMVASLALAWIGGTGFSTDILWTALAEPGNIADRLWCLQGFQADPLGMALVARWGPRAKVDTLADGFGGPWANDFASAFLQACEDAEDEAARATAAVIARLNEGRVPLALVAQDRLLTRRISAMLHGAGVPLRDETGWKLSTTRAAAQLMCLLRAADPRARSDEVLDLLKQGRAWPQSVVDRLEQAVREHGVSSWRSVKAQPTLAALVPEGFAATLERLQAGRPLEAWLEDWRRSLVDCGMWDELKTDSAGQLALKALRLDEGAGDELREIGLAFAEAQRAAPRWTLAGFTAWVRDVLEGSTFQPTSETNAPVVMLPMAQLLGRGFASVVIPGCDEVTLDPFPETPGPWTTTQRQVLGLPSRKQLAEAAHLAWRHALAIPSVDVLWRRQKDGEPLAPSAWVQALPGFSPENTAFERSLLSAREIEPSPIAPPQPVAPDLVPMALSASAYQDLRDCPYKFFALRQLRVSEASELELEPDQRDLGNWLHAVLRRFHEERGAQRPSRENDSRRLNEIGDEVAQAMGLRVDENDAGFLPYLAAWPALREGYLDWLTAYEGRADRVGPTFDRAEWELSNEVRPWRLIGKLDRVDRQDSPEGPIPLVIDYKTEGRKSTEDRIKDAFEDTQLAFYAALLPEENLRAAYLSITDGRSATAQRPATHLFEQPEILQARERLRQGLVEDLSRVAAGQTLPALGEGRVCEFCAARGLCRKDFWAST